MEQLQYCKEVCVLLFSLELAPPPPRTLHPPPQKKKCEHSDNVCNRTLLHLT